MSKLKHFDYSEENYSYFVTITFKYRLKEEIFSKLFNSLLSIFNETDFMCEALVVMPDHIHFVTKKEKNTKYTLSDLICILKSKSVYLLKQKIIIPESFWLEKYYEHVIRNEKDWVEKIKYIINNPLKANIVNYEDSYPYLYCNFDETGDTRPPSTRDDEMMVNSRLHSKQEGLLKENSNST